MFLAGFYCFVNYSNPRKYYHRFNTHQPCYENMASQQKHLKDANS